jgi:hypothetical protein
MQQDHAALSVDLEKHPGDSVLDQVSSHFGNAVAQWPASRHTNWPAKLHGLDILADAFPVVG